MTIFITADILEMEQPIAPIEKENEEINWFIRELKNKSKQIYDIMNVITMSEKRRTRLKKEEV